MHFPNFRIFFFGQLVSVAGTWMQTVAQNWVVWELTRDPRWLGIVSGSGAILYLIFSTWGGQVADRFSKRAVLIWTQILMMLLAFVLTLLATNRWVRLEPWHIAALSGLSGAVNAFNMPAQMSLVNELIDRKDALSNAIALSSFRFNVARFIGPVVAGVTLVKYGAPSCFAINGVSYIAVLISLSMLKLRPSLRMSESLNVWEGFRYIWRTHRVLRVVLLIASYSVFAISASTLFPMISDHFHRKAAGYSQLTMANGIGAMIGAFSLAAIGARVPRLVFVFAGAFVTGIGLLAFAASPAFPISFWIIIPTGTMMIAFAMSCNTLVQEEVPDSLRGRTMAVYSLVFQGMMPLGGIEVSFLARHFGAFAAIRFNAIVFTAAVLTLFLWNLREGGGFSRVEKPSDLL